MTDESWLGAPTVEETAYHEAGHIVVASAVGLHLRQAGLVIWEGVNGYFGCAAIWEDEQWDKQWDKQLCCLRAGAKAQLRRYPSSSAMWGSHKDDDEIFDIVRKHFNGQWSDMEEKIDTQVDILLENNWSAVDAVAQAVIAGDWKPAEDQGIKATRKKQLDGVTLEAILETHGIPAVVR